MLTSFPSPHFSLAYTNLVCIALSLWLINFPKDTTPYFSTVKEDEKIEEPSFTRNVASVITFEGVEYYVYKVNTRASRIGFYFRDLYGNPYRTIEYLRRDLKSRTKELMFATNGGIFRRDGTPEGLFVQDGITYYPINLRDGYGNFYLKPNGVFFINKHGYPQILESYTYFQNYVNEQTDLVQHAIQSGPMLLQNGHINQNFNAFSSHRYIRNGVGTLKGEDTRNWVIFAMSRAPVTFYEFASFFSEVLDCKDALYLDGEISELYLPELGLEYTQNQFAVLIGVTKF